MQPASHEHASALFQAGRPADAADALDCADTFAPGREQSRLLLARALYAAGRIVRCEETCRALLADGVDRPASLNLLCKALAAQGRIHEALALSHALLQETNYRPDLHSRTIHWAPCDDTLSGDDLLALSRQYARHDSTARTERDDRFANDPSDGRRLRVGFMSVELFDHSKYFVTRSLIAALDRRQIQTFVYADVKSPDAFTVRARQAADTWRDIHGLTDDEVVRTIRADGIDILVDSMGHVPRTRLRCLLQKPAPILVEYSEAPSGLSIFDYRITDAVADPVGTERPDGARPVRIPGGFHVYEPPADLPPIRPAPEPYASCPVFCSFSAAQKLGPGVLAAWRSILRAVPDAWLVLKASSFRDDRFVAAFRQSFEAEGIDPSRVRCLPTMPERRWHLLSYNVADVALDTFPYTGVVTTCEALWMGTPVVTLCGSHHVARRGASLLHSAGLDDLITHSPDEYVQRAVQLIHDSERLALLRDTLRDGLTQGPLGQPRRLAAQLERAFRAMWRAWCARQARSDR